jgi:hypothetical protein
MKRPFAAIHSLLFLPLIFCSMKSGASTVAVGNCIPQVTSYNTISEAVAAVPANSTVLVCPGTYPEQITFSTALTLRGAYPNIRPVITVPPEGLTGPQLTIQLGTDLSQVTVNLVNLIVDGTGSTGATGISYDGDSGELSNLEVRNQTTGIELFANDSEATTIDLHSSYVHGFSETGVLTHSPGATAYFVNIRRNLIASAYTAVEAGISSGATSGSISDNDIMLDSGIGISLLLLSPPTVDIERNYIEGCNIGISSQIGGEVYAQVIKDNALVNNGIGIDLSADHGGDEITGNLISQSGSEAINLNCSSGNSLIESNAIFGTPLGVANTLSGDTVVGNKFVNVSKKQTTCQN